MDEESKLCTDYCASFAAGNFGKRKKWLGAAGTKNH